MRPFLFRSLCVTTIAFGAALPMWGQVTGDTASAIRPNAMLETGALVAAGAAAEGLATAASTIRETTPVAPPARPYTSLMSRERVPMGQLIDTYGDFYPSREFLRVLASNGRRPVVSAPFNLRLRAQEGNSRFPGAIDPTLTRLYVVDSSVGAVVTWFADRYDIDFKISTTPYKEGGEGATMTVARGAGRVGNTIVSIMIWNPTAAGRRRGSTRFVERTSVEVQERAYRSRNDLVVEGPDAVVEFTWKVPYSKLIQQASARYQIDPYFLAALVQQESGFNASALSVDSAMGLTQMIPGTAAMMGVTNPNDPKQSIDGGARYLKLMLQKFRGDPELALAAYNAGPGNVVKYKGVPPFSETRDYVRRIMARYREKAAGAMASRAKVVRKS